MAEYYQKQPTVGDNKPAFRWTENWEKTLKVNGIYIVEIIKLRHEANANLKSWRETRERMVKEYGASWIWGNCKQLEKIVQKLGRLCLWATYVSSQGVTGVYK